MKKERLATLLYGVVSVGVIVFQLALALRGALMLWAARFRDNSRPNYASRRSYKLSS
jgi:hypothetical protein